MGVYIPNMEKPKECGDCNFVQAFWDDKRWLFRCLVTDKIAEDCPLIEIDLVRCGECKHQVKQWHEDNRRKDKGFYIYWCDRNEDPFVAHTVSGEPTDFCSYGEREAEDFNPYQGERDRDENGEIY